MKDDMTGPALGKAEANWVDYPRADLYSWIRNSQALIAAKHPRTLAMPARYDNVEMTSFPNLTDEQIEALLLYINKTSTGI